MIYLYFQNKNLGFLIPGTNLSLLMVITISDENGTILGQTKFSLKDRGSNIIGGLRKKESLILGDSGKIMVFILLYILC